MSHPLAWPLVGMTLPVALTAAAASAQVSTGERLYLRGVSAAGSAVEATLQGDVHVKSSELPCVGCHRRSGMGGAEGALVVPPLVGSVLFSPVTQGAPQLGTPRTLGPGTRPAYDDAALLRAVRDGLAASGRALAPTMPRYAIGEADARALASFLRGLGEGAPPGVTDDTIRLATIVTPGVSDADRTSMLDVLRAFTRAKNGGTRHEARRRTNGGWDMKQQYQGYRGWLLDEWDLSGAPSSWQGQLEELYRKAPAFAVVGGITDGDWTPIDDFCARHGLPAVLPQSPLPPAIPSGDGFYSLYFSRGVIAEARLIARHLQGRVPSVRQIARCGSAGEAAARELSRSLTAVGTYECVPADVPLGADWPRIVGQARRLVLWLDARDRTSIDALAESPALAAIDEVYLSSTLLGDASSRLPAPLVGRALLAHPFVPPQDFERHAARSLAWMRASGIQPANRRVAVNALFAAVLTSDALSMPRTLGSREYFVETIEHMAGRSLNPTAYPSVSFEPGRRFASEGGYLLKPPAAPDQPYGKVEEWSVPGS